MIEVHELAKTFPGGFFGRPVAAVRSVSFRCAPGEATALVGSNGAGKTTTLRMLATAIRPTGGDAQLAGFDVHRDAPEIRRRIGFLSTNTGLYLRLTPRELLTHYARLYSIPADRIPMELARAVELLELESFLDRQCDKLSTGMRQRVSLARTILHDPPILILDEPTLGLDIDANELVMSFLERCRDEGKTILLSTHVMGEVARLCRRVIVMAAGSVVFDGKTQELVSAHESVEAGVRAVMRGAR
ncbi:ATP-binding cassette domain-containing protein [bacterium]|nr:ATP-binding cassette domain-containing protein [bacterium]